MNLAFGVHVEATVTYNGPQVIHLWTLYSGWEIPSLLKSCDREI